MPIKGYSCRNPLELLRPDELEEIHRGSLEILEDPGVVFEDDEALDILSRSGCRVDRSRNLVQFPPQLVESCIGEAPERFTLRARNPEYELTFGGERVYFGNFATRDLIDPETGLRRSPLISDLAEITRLCDALKEVHFIIQPFAYLQDAPANLLGEWIYATVVRNTEKITNGPSFFGSAPGIVRIAETVGQDVLGGICAASPLTYPADQAQGIIAFTRSNNPVLILSGPSMGATGPGTVAGSLVLQNAEILAGLVLAQLVNPGIGVLYTGYFTPMDMRYGTMAGGAIEVGLGAVATAQLARRYRIPSGIWSPMTDAKIPDSQSTYEKSTQIMLSALAGLNFSIPIGGHENESAHSLEQIMIDHEVCAMAGRYLDGVRVDKVTMAVDLIREVGPIPGNYLAKKHTLKWWPREYLIPPLSNKEPFDRWEKGGSRAIASVARKRAEEIIRTHPAPDLDPGVDREISRILKVVERAKG